jgi:hypothetical protein
MKNIILLAICVAVSFLTYAQKGMIAGIITSSETNAILNGATIRLYKQDDAAFKKMDQTDEKGFFSFLTLPKGVYNITISYVGYLAQPISGITVNDSIVNLGKITMQRKPKEETAAVVVGKTVVTQKADTIIYSAAQFKTNPDATVEDLVRKMPGITIENGVVKAQGEEVKKVTIDGKDFFGDDATAALKNLPADIVDKIQVFDRQSDQAAFTGFDDGNSQKALNIVTKSGLKNGQFGRAYAGAGTKNTYNVGGNMAFFNGNRRIAIIGQTNNVNQQNFSIQDILGVTGNSMSGGGGRGGGMSMMGGGRGGGRGNSGSSFGGGGGGFFVGSQNGINATNALGINFNDVWGKKVTVSGSYFFNNNNNNQDQYTSQQTFYKADSTLFNIEDAVNQSKNFNNRINMRLEYKIDSANSIIFSPNISFQNNESTSNSTNDLFYNNSSLPVSDQISNNERITKGYNFGGSVLYRHAFPKKGRTISLSVNSSINNRDGDTYTYNFNTYYKSFGTINDSINQYANAITNGATIGGSINYTEPIGKDGQLQFSYSPNLNINKSDQQTFKYDYASKKYGIFSNDLSNKFDNTYFTNNAGVTFRKGNRDQSVNLGFSVQNANLKSNQIYPSVVAVERNFFNILPEARWEKKINAKNSFRINYRTNTNAPSISQLQNVINNSNSLFITTGNPDLKQSFSNSFSTRYTFTNGAKGKSFFLNSFIQNTNQYITNASFIANKDSVLNPSVTLFRGSQLSKPVNVNGYYSIRNFLTYGSLVKAIKTNVNTSIGYSYVNTPGIVNGKNNTSKSNIYTANLNLSSNVSQYVDFNVSLSANYNKVKNTLQPSLNQNYTTYNSSAQINLLSKTGWFLQNDINNQTNTGLTNGLNQSIWLWNAGIGKKFLKDQKGELKLSVFDLLHQNQSIQRTVSETGITDAQNVVLTQYFMLTFTYKLKNFGNANKYNTNNSNKSEEIRDRMRGEGRPF